MGDQSVLSPHNFVELYSGTGAKQHISHFRLLIGDFFWTFPIINGTISTSTVAKERSLKMSIKLTHSKIWTLYNILSHSLLNGKFFF